MKYLLIAAILLLSTSVYALNETEVAQIRDAIVPPLNATDVRIESKIDALNITVRSLNLTPNAVLSQDQINSLLSNLSVSINNACDPEALVSDGDFQKTLEAGMDNAFDRNQQDAQAWFTETLLPTRDEIDLLEEEKYECEVDRQNTNVSYYALVVTSNETQRRLEAELKVEHKDTEFWQRVSLLLALVLLLTNREFILNLINRKTPG